MPDDTVAYTDEDRALLAEWRAGPGSRLGMSDAERADGWTHVTVRRPGRADHRIWARDENDV